MKYISMARVVRLEEHIRIFKYEFSERLKMKPKIKIAFFTHDCRMEKNNSSRERQAYTDIRLRTRVKWKVPVREHRTARVVGWTLANAHTSFLKSPRGMSKA